VRAGRGEGDAVRAGVGEERAAQVALAGGRGVGVLAASAADLDLGLDELAADRLCERPARAVAQLLEARGPVPRLRVEEGELLLEAHGAVLRRREGLDRSVEIEHVERPRSDRSRARRAGPRRGWRYGPSPRAAPAEGCRSS